MAEDSDGECRDRVSDLPDPIIHHIFSFLDTRIANQTCVLSKRWRHLSKSLPFLTFNCGLFHENFHNFLYEYIMLALSLHDGSPIHTFTLHCCNTRCWSCKPRDLHTILRIAVSRGVRQLHIRVQPQNNLNYVFYDGLFTSRFLTSLKLDFRKNYYSPYTKISWYDRTSDISLPDHICLPSLVNLHLSNFRFFDEEALSHLISNSPNLKTLLLANCVFVNNLTLTISANNLIHLKIDMLLLSPHFAMHEGKREKRFIELSTPNLVSFEFRDYFFNHYTLGDLSSLQFADMDIVLSTSDLEGCIIDLELRDKDVRCLMNCLSDLYNIKSLTLSPSFIKVILKLPHLLASFGTLFNNLRYLKLPYWISKGCFKVIMDLLKNSPNIETFIIENATPEDDAANKYENDFTFYKLPFTLDHLKLIEVRNVLQRWKELKFLEILLKKAVKLERMTIFTSKFPSIMRQIETFEKNLLKFRRSSLYISIVEPATTSVLEKNAERINMSLTSNAYQVLEELQEE